MGLKVRVRVRGGVLIEKATELVPLWDALQLTGKWREWQSRERVSRQKGERLVAAGKAERIERMHEGFVQTVGYRRTKSVRVLRRSKCTLTKSTLDHVSDAVRSDDRHERHPEVVKFHIWSNIPETFRDAAGNFVPAGVYKSPTIRPRVSEEDEKRALALLRIELPKAEVVALPVVVVSTKPLEQRTAAQALLAAGPMLGLKAKPAVGVRVA